jgi:hypothetical protein
LASQIKEANTMSSSIKVIGPQDQFQKVLDNLAKCEMDSRETQMVWEDVQKDWNEVAKMYAKDRKSQSFYHP